MKGFESEKEDLEVNAQVNWKPMELFKNRLYVFSGSGLGYNVGS